MAESETAEKRSFPKRIREWGREAYITELFDATKEQLRMALWAGLGAEELNIDAYKGRGSFTKKQLVALVLRVWMLQHQDSYPDELQDIKGEAEKLGKVTLPDVDDWHPEDEPTIVKEDSALPESVYLSREQRPVYVAKTRNRLEGNKIAESRNRDRAIAAVADALGEDYRDSFAHGVHVHIDEIFRVDNGRCTPLGGPDYVDTSCPDCGGLLVYTQKGRREKGSGPRTAACAECGTEIEATRKTCITVRK